MVETKRKQGRLLQPSLFLETGQPQFLSDSIVPISVSILVASREARPVHFSEIAEA